MKIIHFDSKGRIDWHYYFWQPWGCWGCLLRGLLFMLLLALFLFLMSLFRNCSGNEAAAPAPGSGERPPVSDVVPPINEDDVIDDGGRQVVANRLNVLFGAECGQQEYESWVQQFQTLYPDEPYQVLFYDPNTKLMQIQVEAERRVELITELPQQIPDIPFMVFDEEMMEMNRRPNDPVFNHSDHAYHYQQTDAYDAWDVTEGSPNVIVAVVDSYFDLSHIDFADTHIVHPYSVETGDTIVAVPDSFDPNNIDGNMAHGTMTAGFISANSGNGRASAGIAPKCSLMPISLGMRFGNLSVLQGVLYAINKGATVINISIGAYFTEQILQLSDEEQIEISRTEFLASEAVWHYVYDMAVRNYVTLVWAAGNQDVFTALDSSKRGDNIIKVSATDASMSKAEFSNYGNFAQEQIYESTVSAPGVQVPGLVPHTAGYTLVDGTSFSAPIVAGGVALMKSSDPTLTTPEIIDILKQTGKPVRGSSTIGPIVQFGKALQAVYGGFIAFNDFQTAVTSGQPARDMTIASLARLSTSNATALPPVIVSSIRPTGANTGKIVYEIHTLEPFSISADYSASIQNGKIILQVQASETHDNVQFGPATITIAAENSLAVIDSMEAQWIDDANSMKCHIKKPTT